jgi:hypothetical protein
MNARADPLRLRNRFNGGAPASGSGSLSMMLRITSNDRANGDLTISDFVFDFPFDIANGEAQLKTSIDAFVNFSSRHGLPPCTVAELVALAFLRGLGL